MTILALLQYLLPGYATVSRNLEHDTANAYCGCDYCPENDLDGSCYYNTNSMDAEPSNLLSYLGPHPSGFSTLPSLRAPHVAWPPSHEHEERTSLVSRQTRRVHTSDAALASSKPRDVETPSLPLPNTCCATVDDRRPDRESSITEVERASIHGGGATHGLHPTRQPVAEDDCRPTELSPFASDYFKAELLDFMRSSRWTSIIKSIVVGRREHKEGNGQHALPVRSRSEVLQKVTGRIEIYVTQEMRRESFTDHTYYADVDATSDDITKSLIFRVSSPSKTRANDRINKLIQSIFGLPRLWHHT